MKDNVMSDGDVEKGNLVSDWKGKQQKGRQLGRQ